MPTDATQAPDCPRCRTEMVRRTTRKGPNQGQQFWGCPRFPRCRGTIADTPPSDPVDSTTPETSTAPTSGVRGRLAAAAGKIVEAVDNAQRRTLEADEPDATGRWDPEHRRKVLRWVYDRDGGRCGLCAGEMKLDGAVIEHIAPKIFAVFDVRKGSAEPGTRYTSRLHKMDNLQAAHTYCNKRKGNSPKVKEWRHPAMSPLPVAVTADGFEFVVPYKTATR